MTASPPRWRPRRHASLLCGPRPGADWLYAHLLDGDLASNHLSWQWVAGTGSRKPYLFNAENVARHAPAAWHSPGSLIDTSYEALDEWARSARSVQRSSAGAALITPTAEAEVRTEPPEDLGLGAPGLADVADLAGLAGLGGREVWLVHPCSLGTLAEPHLAPWLAHWAECEAVPTLFPAVARRCDSFSPWWTRVSRGSAA